MFGYGWLKWFSYIFKFGLFIIFIIRVIINGSLDSFDEPAYLALGSKNFHQLTTTARNCMIVVTVIVFVAAISSVITSKRGMVYACVVDFIVSIALAIVMLSQDDFDRLNKDGLDFIIVYLLFGFALIEVITGYKARKKSQEERTGTVIGFSNHAMTVPAPARRPPAAIVSDPTSRIIAVQTPQGVKVVGIEEQHAILEDGQGGIIVVKKTNAASLGANENGDISLGDVEEVQFFHITRQAILANPDNPDIRVITSAEVNRINLSQRDRSQITALRGR
uniref:Uncharacterized protein n=1 Tax=Clytia hemisphaerica TaxID=252671 RepID=A0A7M5XLU5_9CNID